MRITGLDEIIVDVFCDKHDWTASDGEGVLIGRGMRCEKADAEIEVDVELGGVGQSDSNEARYNGGNFLRELKGRKKGISSRSSIALYRWLLLP